MRAMDATGWPLVVSSLAVVTVACRDAPRRPAAPAAAPPAVTVYLPPQLAARLVERFQMVAARHGWALSVRTDTAALREADLVIRDSAGTLVGRLRPGSPAAAQAKLMADSVLLR